MVFSESAGEKTVSVDAEREKVSDGLRAKFPKYDYDDMVQAQYRLLTEHLGVKRLRLVMGTSMGAMHAWMWGYMFPGFMDGLVPLASNPVTNSRRVHASLAPRPRASESSIAPPFVVMPLVRLFLPLPPL